MNNLVEPQSPETKQALENLGLKPWAPETYPNYANPDKMEYHLTNAVVLGLSFAGRWYAGKLGVTRMPFTASIVMVPTFYMLAIFQKEKRFVYDAGERRSFQQNLEFYPVTRRAWNRAVAIRNAEVAELKQKSQ